MEFGHVTVSHVTKLIHSRNDFQKILYIFLQTQSRTDFFLISSSLEENVGVNIENQNQNFIPALSSSNKKSSSWKKKEKIEFLRNLYFF